MLLRTAFLCFATALACPVVHAAGPADDPRLVALAAGIDIRPLDWATLALPYDRLRVTVGDVAQTAWPGGGAYGAVSAITGAIDIPAAADADLIGTGVSRTIVNAGVSGLAVTHSLTAPAVGLYGSAGLARERGGAWAMNLTVRNFASAGPGGSSGFNGQVTALEGDVGLHRPPGGWAGSNVDGVWLPLDADSQPDGEANMLHIGIVGAAPWKNGVKIDAGSTTFAREVGPASRGTGPSIGTFDHYVVRDAAGAALHVIQGYDLDGGLVLRPLTPGKASRVRLQDAAGRVGVSLEAGPGDVVLAGSIVSRGERPRITCPGATLDPAATDLRGRVTIPPGRTRCTVHLAIAGGAEPYVVVSGNVPGLAPAALPGGPDEAAAQAFTIALPEGARVPVTVTWIAIR